MKTGLPDEEELRLETRFQAARMGERSSPSGRQRSVLLRAKVCPFAPGGVLAAVVARAAVSGSAAVWRGKPVPGVGDGCFCSVLCPFLLCFALFAANACRCFPVFRVVLSAFCALLLASWQFGLTACTGMFLLLVGLLFWGCQPFVSFCFFLCFSTVC